MSEISQKAREAAREEYDVNKIGHIGDDNDDEYSFFTFLFHHTRHAIRASVAYLVLMKAGNDLLDGLETLHDETVEEREGEIEKRKGKTETWRRE
ncbi:hypothetical protein Pcinc_012323 [Petrolisthes cinctipes]|uniref:Uncharacterized protein n=1 Tax=Petrolisthes cinctipes TaxID=88211 RepID=A0AAE1KSQ4_PETCI|nr:hypothetical protein Pcinc_012323 [Petrolisthes cinctipes]